MKHRSDPTARWWCALPTRQVSYLADVDPELLSMALDPLPAQAPAVVQLSSYGGGQISNQVDVYLEELERVAVALFPRWLSGAERLDGSGHLGAAAVRAMAEQAAARSPAFGPFLVDLAEHCLGVYVTRRSRLPAEVRAFGLARVIAEAYRRDSTVLLIDVPTGLTPGQERSLTNTAEWFVHHGGFAVWLAGESLHAVDRVQSVPITLPASLMRLTAETEHDRSSLATSRMAVASEARATPDQTHIASADPKTRTSAVMFPPLSGLPRQDSAAELALERALASCEWAQGRHWNLTYEWQILGRPYRLDLFWPDSGLVVEVDGPEHRGRLKYADDRHRDVNLQLLGYDVLRFTNEQVLWDAQAVVMKIEQLLSRRRAANELNPEMTNYAQH